MVQETSENPQAAAQSNLIIERGMYLTDGRELYFVREINKNGVFLENCFTLSSHTRNLNDLSRWTEVKIEKL